MSDLDFLIHILNNLPELYDVVLDGMESKLMLPDGDENKLTLESVREKLNGRYERIQGRVQEKKEDAEEIALLAQFKGMCNKCGKYGHKGADCRKRQSQVICYYCGCQGHIKNDCELLKAHKEGKGEKALQAIQNQESESSDDESLDELAF